MSELCSPRIAQIDASYIVPFSHANPSELLLLSLPCQITVIPAHNQALTAGSASLPGVPWMENHVQAVS